MWEDPNLHPQDPNSYQGRSPEQIAGNQITGGIAFLALLAIALLIAAYYLAPILLPQ